MGGFKVDIHSKRRAVSGGQHIQEARLQTEDGDLVLGEDPDCVLPRSFARFLDRNQEEGVRRLLKQHTTSHLGTVLGNDAGWGKSLQCAAFLKGLFLIDLIRRALVVVPRALLACWEADLRRYGLAVAGYYYKDPRLKRERALARVLGGKDVQKPGHGVLLCTYGMGARHPEDCWALFNARAAGGRSVAQVEAILAQLAAGCCGTKK
ncbi:hypothetical protein WJX81_008256 [Elliptochloris bilobata]|uniref:SNF2 N-terminal domain-containing protein n=1 Tax=Elliptochloris bilobata TaxID=381761 RepID=A0AAW1QJY7_9CHLO